VVLSTNTLGRYRIIRELARSNDIVYEAVDPANGHRIALKELQMPQNLVGQARRERIQRFTREARAAAKLQHPNVVRIIEHGQAGERYFIAMEFLQGLSLRDTLRNRGALPLQEALRITVAAADGLEFAHRNGVVHRDVKPDNIHLEPDGRVVLTDFGIARLTFEPTLTADGQIFGTPSYMSPEQVSGKNIDRRSDVFSLGVMLYEMVAGRKPFTGDSVITITYNIMNMEPPPIADAPPGVNQIIRKATAKNQSDRYDSCSQLIEDLRLVQQGQPPRYASKLPPARHAPAPAPAPAYAAPMPAPPLAQPPLPPGGRALPQPQFGAMGAAAMPMPAGPVPGARPMSRPLPGNGAHPLPPAPVPQSYPPSPVANSHGSNALWLMAWLGVAAIIGLIVVALLYAGTTSFERYRRDSGQSALNSSRSEADKLFSAGRFEEALPAYLKVAQGSQGQAKTVALKSAAAAAAEAAEGYLDKKNSVDAERFARQSVELNPDLPSAYLTLGRALAMQGKIEEALAQFDVVPSAAERTLNSDAPEAEKAAAKATRDTLPSWKADLLYRDGERLMGTDRNMAIKRFQQVIEVAPRTNFARNAQIQLSNMQATLDSGTPASIPGLNGPTPPGSNPGVPPNWDSSTYRLLQPE
jgi:serine/threonine-protein kinase